MARKGLKGKYVFPQKDWDSEHGEEESAKKKVLNKKGTKVGTNLLC